MGNERLIAHVDMDSYFATLEQQANPTLRGKPIVVSGKVGSRSVIVASSKEAKKIGIKTGMLPFEAQRIFPKVIFIEPDGAKYEFASRLIFKIFLSFTDFVEVFSIDEAFLDLSDQRIDLNLLQKIGFDLKRKIKKELGEFVTCSIGMAPNKFLAKLASDKCKPDGFFIVNEKNKDNLLINSKLTDFCGLGNGFAKRLENLGVNTVFELRKMSLLDLKKYFGSFAGQKLHNLAFGVDFSPVLSHYEKLIVKSISRTYTLSVNTYEKKIIFGVVVNLLEMALFELRQKKLAAKTVIVFFRYANFTYVYYRKTLNNIEDKVDVFVKISEKFLHNLILRNAVRLVGVYLTNLYAKNFQKNLFQQENRLADLQQAIDSVKIKYGQTAIKRAVILQSEKMREKVGGFKLADYEKEF